MSFPGFDTLQTPVHGKDHVHGPSSARWTLVEYGDYECPDCGELYLLLRDFQKQEASSLRVVYRHYPLSGVHRHAQEAAEAAEAAGAQGRFWDMHAVLFENPQKLKTKDLVRYAESLALDVDQFRHELRHGVHRERVRTDFIAGAQNGVNGTPGLFLNEVRLQGKFTVAMVRTAIEELGRDESAG